jgi:hypothetical protein
MKKYIHEYSIMMVVFSIGWHLTIQLGLPFGSLTLKEIFMLSIKPLFLMVFFVLVALLTFNK